MYLEFGKKQAIYLKIIIQKMEKDKGLFPLMDGQLWLF